MTSRSTCPLCCYAESDTFAHLDHRVIARCSECSFLFAAEFDTDELERKYRKEYYASPDDPRIQKWIDQHSRVWRGLVDDVLRTRTDVANLLDIGAGTGGFLEAFHSASPATRLLRHRVVTGSPVKSEAASAGFGFSGDFGRRNRKCIGVECIGIVGRRHSPAMPRTRPRPAGALPRNPSLVKPRRHPSGICSEHILVQGSPPGPSET